MKNFYSLYVVVLALVLVGTGASVFALQQGTPALVEAELLSRSEAYMQSNQRLNFQHANYDCVLADAYLCHARGNLKEIE